MKNEAEWEKEEIEYLYQIANVLPGFLEAQGFSAESARGVLESKSEQLHDNVRPYYRDYISNHIESGYQSLHITFYDNSSRSYMEVQLRTKTMDDIAEIGAANHKAYEKKQEQERYKKESYSGGREPVF